MRTKADEPYFLTGHSVGSIFLGPDVLDEDAPPRREDARCVDCEAKMNSYNAAYDIRCYNCKRKWLDLADELAEKMSWENFPYINIKTSRAFDACIIEFITRLRAKSTGVYYGNAFQDIADRTNRNYEPGLRNKSRRLLRQGKLERPNGNNRTWVIPNTEYHQVEQLELIMLPESQSRSFLRRESNYEHVVWAPKRMKWLATVNVNGMGRNLGFCDTEEEAHDLAVGFLAMQERMKEEDDVVETEPTFDDLELIMEETHA